MSCINQLVLESLIEEINLWSNPNRKLNLSNPDQAWSGGTIGTGLQQQFDQNAQNAKNLAYNRVNTRIPIQTGSQQTMLPPGSKAGQQRISLDRTSLNLGPRLGMASGFNSGNTPLVRFGF